MSRVGRADGALESVSSTRPRPYGTRDVPVNGDEARRARLGPWGADLSAVAAGQHQMVGSVRRA